MEDNNKTMQGNQVDNDKYMQGSTTGQSPYQNQNQNQMGQPQYGQPQYGQPQYGQPQYGQPQYQNQSNAYDRNAEFYGQQAAKVQNMNILAITSMAIGLISIVASCCCFGGILGIIGLILGIIAVRSIFCTKKAVAVTGIVTSIIALLLTVVLTIVILCGAYESKKIDNIKPKYNYEYEYEYDNYN